LGAKKGFCPPILIIEGRVPGLIPRVYAYVCDLEQGKCAAKTISPGRMEDNLSSSTSLFFPCFRNAWRLSYFFVTALTWIGRASESVSGAI